MAVLLEMPHYEARLLMVNAIKTSCPPNKKVAQQTKSVNNNAIKHPQTGQEKWVNFFTAKKILLISRKGRATTNWSKKGEGGGGFLRRAVH